MHTAAVDFTAFREEHDYALSASPRRPQRHRNWTTEVTMTPPGQSRRKSPSLTFGR